jgi:hypothetical protein
MNEDIVIRFGGVDSVIIKKEFYQMQGKTYEQMKCRDELVNMLGSIAYTIASVQPVQTEGAES